MGDENLLKNTEPEMMVYDFDAFRKASSSKLGSMKKGTQLLENIF